MPPKVIELKAIKDPVSDYAELEKRLIKAFRKAIYEPLLKALSLTARVLNSDESPLIQALQIGKVAYSGGAFRGRFNADVSRELKGLGAVWDKRTNTFILSLDKMPSSFLLKLGEAQRAFEVRMLRIDRMLGSIRAEDVAVPVSDLFDSALWTVEKDFQKSIDKITVAPQLSAPQRAKIAEEWSNNMDLWIKDWVPEHIKELRKTVESAIYQGDRYESLIGGIKASYGVSTRKARFLARQETNLLMAKFKETRYTAAGVNEYRWGCVKMPHDASPAQHTPGNVRYYHGILEGQVFRWDEPPITNRTPERRNNPGQDYNCRCFPRPIVRF